MVDYDENYLSSRLTEPELLVERQGSSGGFLKGVFSSAAIKCMSPLRRSAERLTAAPVRSVRQASQGLAEPPGRNVGWWREAISAAEPAARNATNVFRTLQSTAYRQQAARTLETAAVSPTEAVRRNPESENVLASGQL